jgi:hypothetical protein
MNFLYLHAIRPSSDKCVTGYDEGRPPENSPVTFRFTTDEPPGVELTLTPGGRQKPHLLLLLLFE